MHWSPADGRPGSLRLIRGGPVAAVARMALMRMGCSQHRHHHHLARRDPRRADLSSSRGLFHFRHERPSHEPAIDLPRPAGRLPRLRHHPARRRPAGGAQPLRRRQAVDRPAARRPRRRLHRGRLAGRQPQGHRVLPPGPAGARPQARQAGGVRRDPAGRRTRGRRPAGRRAARQRRERRDAGRQVARPPRRAGAAHHAGGEPRDGPRHRRATCAPRARRCSSTPSTSSTATALNRDYALEVLRTAYEAGA